MVIAHVFKRLILLPTTIILSMFCTLPLFATTQIAGDGTTTPATNNFSSPISAKAFDRSTGTMYVATSAAATNSAYTLASAGPSATAFTGLAVVQPTLTYAIDANAGDGKSTFPTPLMGVLKAPGSTQPWVVAITTGGQALSVFDGLGVQTNVIGTPYNLFQADNTGVSTFKMIATTRTGGNRLCTGIQNGATINGSINGSIGKAFVYVCALQGAGYAGTNVTDGVCCANIALDTGNPVPDTFTGGNITPGLSQALPLGAENAAVSTGGVLGMWKVPGRVDVNGGWVNDLYWDNDLQVLYAGVSLWDKNNKSDKSNALVFSSVDAGTGALTGWNKADGTTGDQGPAAYSTQNVNTVFSVTQGSFGFNKGSVTMVRKIRTMKTSTNFKYLILNATAAPSKGQGKIADLATPVPSVWAVRVAMPGSAVTTTGQVVQNALVNGADVALPNTSQGWTAAQLGATQVGNGPLPLATDGSTYITDMEVIGDTVYASLGVSGAAGKARNTGVDIGLFASRALFDATGVIIGWTTWEQVLTVEEAGSSATTVDNISFFNVDANTGSIWKVCNDGTSNKPTIVKRGTWTSSWSTNTALAAQLNAILTDGCTAVLDLPTGTSGIGDAKDGSDASNSFALFGGNGTVVFAQTKSGKANVVTTDFSKNTAFLPTTLSGAGYVRALGISRYASGDSATKNYFFAGTDNGLYAYVNDSINSTRTSLLGFDGNTKGMTDLSGIPFASVNSTIPGWVQMAPSSVTDMVNPITGAVTAIEANGTYLFVVEQDTTSKGEIVSKLHQFTIDASVGTMEGSAHGIIATSGQGAIPANTIFTGFALVQSKDDGTASYGILSTNQGVYISSAVISAVTGNSTTSIGWTQVDSTTTPGTYTVVKSQKRLPGTVGTADGISLNATISSICDDSRGFGFYQNSNLSNVGINWKVPFDGTLISSSAPKLNNYVNAPTTNSGNGISYLDRITSLWTDGGRRFFSTYNPNVLTRSSSLVSMPYYTSEWSTTSVTPVALTGYNHINWIENISGVGILMVGTDKGVVTLE